jgi:hypothetical protein
MKMQSLVSQSLSDKQIMKLVEGKARLVTHDKIRQFDTLEQLLGKHKACIILYVGSLPNNSIYGHWCCVFMSNDKVVYFDPYGNPPDDPLTYMSADAIKEFGNQPALGPLLSKYRGLVVYNTVKLQKKDKAIANCGRLTGLRLQFRDLSSDDFNRLLHSYKGICPDQLATIMTSFIT